MNVTVKIKSYPKEAKNLVEIWNKHSDSVNYGIDFVTFVHRRPKISNTNNRRIAGLKAECVSYLKDDQELVKMSVENFLYLMVKCGVDLETNEIKTD